MAAVPAIARKPGGDEWVPLTERAFSRCRKRRACCAARKRMSITSIADKVPGVTPLPSLWLGRRRLILMNSFEQWLLVSERNREKLV